MKRLCLLLVLLNGCGDGGSAGGSGASPPIIARVTFISNRMSSGAETADAVTIDGPMRSGEITFTDASGVRRTTSAYTIEWKDSK